MSNNYAIAYNRLPNWKWVRAEHIVAGTEAPSTVEWDTKKGYEWISRASAFIRSYANEPDPHINTELVTLYGDILTALEIRNDTASYFKEELEAKVLAKLETEEIAVDSGTPVAVIRAYEELFFDVRDKLDQEMYIVNFVIGKNIHNLKADDVATIWKTFAYFQGPEVLKALVRKTVNPQHCSTQDTVEASLQEDFRGGVNMYSAIASKNPMAWGRSSPRYLSFLTKFQEIDKLSGGSGLHAGQINEHILAMLDSLKFTVNGIDPLTGQESPFSKYANNPLEPTLQDLMEIGVTGKSERLEANKDKKFPPPPKKKDRA